MEKCKELNLPLALKMVRGAYINEENKLALEKGIETPVCETLEKTSEMMDSNLKLVFDNLSSNSEVLIGSHNKDTIEIVKSFMKLKNIDPST